MFFAFINAINLSGQKCLWWMSCMSGVEIVNKSLIGLDVDRDGNDLGCFRIDVWECVGMNVISLFICCHCICLCDA